MATRPGQFLGRQPGMRAQHRIPGNTRIVPACKQRTPRNWKQHEAIIMKLFYSKTSPYSRKVRLVIHEKGLQQAITSVVCNPFDEVPELEAANPLGKVPTLIMDDGASLYDSPVICAYLDTLTPDRLIPESGRERWNVLRWEA
ncbi:MAG TPA: hypothetical protein ENK38_05385, partial [Gammaproteobacteria bacterium]|nr:hypothetical protein [Gammaproteobacteria bacterium]